MRSGVSTPNQRTLAILSKSVEAGPDETMQKLEQSPHKHLEKTFASKSVRCLVKTETKL